MWSRGHSVVTGSQCGHGVTVWSRGHRRLLGVVTGSPKDFWCGHGVTEDFWARSQGHRRIFGVVTEKFSPKLRDKIRNGKPGFEARVTEQCCAELASFPGPARSSLAVRNSRRGPGISLCTDLLMRKKLRVYPKFRF